MESYQGRALVASPYLVDGNFMRSVVYMIRHDEEGAMGLVLNRPLTVSIGELLGELTETPIENGLPVFCGGPVDGPVMMLQVSCRQPDDEQAEVLIACDQTRILQEIEQPNSQQLGIRLFDGYSGWGPGQLESEVEDGSWLVWDISPNQLFHDSETLWQMAVVEIGRNVIADGIGIEKFHGDPDYN